MSATIIDSAIFQGIFSSDEMRQVWSDENRTQKYLDVESALARVQGRLGLIPQEAADEIVRHCRLEQIDMAKLRQQTERIGYPILGVVSPPSCRSGKGWRSSSASWPLSPARWQDTRRRIATRR